MLYLPNQKIYSSQMTYDESRRYADIVHTMLKDISKSYNDFKTPLNKEFAYRIIRVAYKFAIVCSSIYVSMVEAWILEHTMANV